MAKKSVQEQPEVNAKTEEQAAAEFFGAVLAERQERSPQAEAPVENQDEWLADKFEGQLAVDVYQTEDDIVIQSTLAGVRVEDIDIAVNNDMVTIRGIRQRDSQVRPEDYFYQECYWGGFSRSIILPVDVRSDRVEATLKNGVLTVILPKADKPRAKSIKVVEEFDDEPEA